MRRYFPCRLTPLLGNMPDARHNKNGTISMTDPQHPDPAAVSPAPSATGPTWTTRPLFVSSTFFDLHDERDHLRVFAFGPLEERLRERRHYLETIDLRQRSF